MWWSRDIDALLYFIVNSHKVSNMVCIFLLTILLDLALAFPLQTLSEWWPLLQWLQFVPYTEHSLRLSWAGAFLPWPLLPQYKQGSWSFGDGPSAASLFWHLYELPTTASVACAKSSCVADLFPASLASTNWNICSRVISWFLLPNKSSCISESSNPRHNTFVIWLQYSPHQHCNWYIVVWTYIHLPALGV